MGLEGRGGEGPRRPMGARTPQRAFQPAAVSARTVLHSMSAVCGQRHLTGLQLAHWSARLGLRPYSSSAANPAHTAPDCRPPATCCCFILQGKN